MQEPVGRGDDGSGSHCLVDLKEARVPCMKPRTPCLWCTRVYVLAIPAASEPI